MNLRGIAEVLIIVVICILLLALIVPHARAFEETGSYVIVEEPTADPTQSGGFLEDVLNFISPSNKTSSNETLLQVPAYNNTRITQGQCVEPGGYYDISGVIGFSTTTTYNEFAYYGKYEDSFDVAEQNFSVEYIYKIPYARKAYYNFYIDPAIFGNRLGYWYQFNGVYERAGNKRAFYVSDKCIKDTNYTAPMIINDTPTLINPYVIEERHVSDVLLSNDDPLFIPNETGAMRVWVFSPSNSGVYPIDAQPNESTNTPILSSDDSGRLSAGSYTILIQRAGNDTRYSFEYEKSKNKTEILTPTLRSIPVVVMEGHTQFMVRDAIIKLIGESGDDVYTTYNMEVQTPKIDISGYQEIEFNNSSVLEVTGYTNKIAGTPITLYVDLNKVSQSSQYESIVTKAENASIGSYRPFHGYIPLRYDNLAPGEHVLTAATPGGHIMGVTMHIIESPEGSVPQKQYYKFVDGHPYIPDPPPVIVEKVVEKIVTKVEIKTVIEKEPVDYKLLTQSIILTLIIPTVLFTVFIVIPAIYSLTVLSRAAVERRKEKLLTVKNDDKQ